VGGGKKRTLQGQKKNGTLGGEKKTTGSKHRTEKFSLRGEFQNEGRAEKKKHEKGERLYTNRRLKGRKNEEG